MAKKNFANAASSEEAIPRSLEEALAEINRLSSHDPLWYKAEKDPLDRLTACLAREEKRVVYKKAFETLGIKLPSPPIPKNDTP